VFGLGPLVPAHTPVLPIYRPIARTHSWHTLIRIKKRVATFKNTWWSTKSQIGTDDKDEDALVVLPPRTILERILDDDFNPMPTPR
jgi:hypothetical protein